MDTSIAVIAFVVLIKIFAVSVELVQEIAANKRGWKGLFLFGILRLLEILVFTVTIIVVFVYVVQWLNNNTEIGNAATYAIALVASIAPVMLWDHFKLEYRERKGGRNGY